MKFPNIPLNIDVTLGRYFLDLSSMLSKELNRRVPNAEPVPELLLVSPARKVYAVRVDDDGNLSTTLVQET